MPTCVLCGCSRRGVRLRKSSYPQKTGSQKSGFRHESRRQRQASEDPSLIVWNPWKKGVPFSVREAYVLVYRNRLKGDASSAKHPNQDIVIRHRCAASTCPRSRNLSAAQMIVQRWFMVACANRKTRSKSGVSSFKFKCLKTFAFVEFGRRGWLILI